MSETPGPSEGPPPYPPPPGPPPPHPPPGQYFPPPGAGALPVPEPASTPAPSGGRRRRVRAVVIAAVAALVLLGAAAIGSTLREQAVPRDLSAVRTYPDLPTTHLRPGQRADYRQSPPVGGPHAPVWIDCGVYDRPLPDENVVHDLEHGTVWLTYRTEGDDALDRDDVARLARLLPENGIMSPYPGQEAPVVVTVWGRQLALTGADDPRLPLFIEAFGGGRTAPEPLASCGGGADPDDVPGSGRVNAAPAPPPHRTQPAEETP